MRVAAALIAVVLLATGVTTRTLADTATPTPLATAPPTLPPTVAAVGSTPETGLTPTPPPTPPVSIHPEHSTPVVSVEGPTATPTAVSPGGQTVSENRGNGTVSVHHGQGPGGVSVAGTSGVGQPPSPASGPPNLPSSSGSTLPDSTTFTFTTSSKAASAPSQLACYGRSHPAAAPFLVTPFDGWTEVGSFLDHDSPDYSVDGKITLANGLVATAGDGVASDMFPAYWSPALRQYVNYDGHNGYDFEISYQPVLAAAAGTVAYAGWNSPDQFSGYGLMVLINHHNGYVTLYGHLSQLDVHTGQRVSAGQTIGISGTTGHSSGPHLHFSVFHDCDVTDPYGWTGSGQDPLRPFDGEESQYLWLPGRDPLLLNPPPNWPTFPLGISVPGESRSSLLARRDVPPATRLLLLGLPQPSADAVSPGVALARTESVIAEEARALRPELEDLRTQGLIDDYQAIPAAAAVWVRGIATASQLEGLPGVASLAGARPRDLLAAEAGLAHSALIQMGQQRAPSLWPVGFRSSLQTWRPVAAVVQGDALIAGVALPGEQVNVTMRRGATVIGAAQTVSDPNSGSFVAMLHDGANGPVPVHSGDSIEVESAGHVCDVRVVRLRLRARSHHLVGKTSRGVSVSLAVRDPWGGEWKSVSTSTAGGDFLAATPGTQPAGTLAVATVLDSAGDQISSTAFVPGIVATIGDSTITGWAVGLRPALAVRRAGRTIFSRGLKIGYGGAFTVQLQRHGAPLALAAGDVIVVGSPRHRRVLSIPRLATSLRASQGAVQITGPAGTPIRLSLDTGANAPASLSAILDASGSSSVPLPAGIGRVQRASTEVVLTSGDRVQALSEARGLILHYGSAIVTGQIPPATTVSIRVSDVRGRYVAGAVASADERTGRVVATLTRPDGRSLALTSGMRLDIRQGASVQVAVVPPMALRPGPTGRVSVAVTDLGHVAVSGKHAMGRSEPVAFHTTPRALSRVTAGWVATSGLETLAVRGQLAGGVTLVRTMRLVRARAVVVASMPGCADGVQQHHVRVRCGQAPAHR